MITAAIVVGIILFGLVCYARHLGNNYDGVYDGLSLGIVVTVLVAIETAMIANIIAEPTPTPLDVYRGNTELKIMSVNGIPTDSVVVFKSTNLNIY